MSPRPAKSPAETLAEAVAQKQITPAEREIVLGFIDHRNTVRPTSRATQKRQTFQSVWICRELHKRRVTLETCGARDLLAVASRASCGDYTQNTRKTKVGAIKSIVKYINRFHRPITDLDLLADVQAGGIDKGRKVTLSLDEWDRVLNAPMSAKERATIAMMYDGYHRPREVLLLKWSDLHVNRNGHVEYEILFKTAKTRVIVQKGTTTAILEMWRQECGANYGDPTPIFPDRNGQMYKSTVYIRDLFDRLRRRLGLPGLVPSALRNTAITHDVEAGLPTSYICLRAWGEPYNDMINVYARPDSGRMQDEQHGKNGLDVVKIDLIGRHTRNVLLCPGCRKPNPHDAAFCYKCGRALTEEAMSETKQIKDLLTPERVQEMIRREVAALRQPGV